MTQEDTVKTIKVARSLLIAFSLMAGLSSTPHTSLAESAEPPPAIPAALDKFVYVPFATGGQPQPVPHITSQIDVTRAVSKEVGLAGGVLNASDRAGGQYSFSIPPNSLMQTTTIWMTPVSLTRGLPYTNGMLMAVHFSPDGLLLFKPGTLVMTPTRVIAPSMRIPYGFTDVGNHFHRRPMKPNTTGLVFDVLHFSGYGVAIGTSQQADATPLHPNNLGEGEFVDAGQRAKLQDPVRAAQEEGQPADPNAGANIEKLARDHYNQKIVPLMGFIVGDCDASFTPGAIAQITVWMHEVEVSAIDSLKAEQKAAGDAIIASFRNCRQKKINECLAKPRPLEPEKIINDMLQYERELQLRGYEDNVDLATPIDECRKGLKWHGTVIVEFDVLTLYQDRQYDGIWPEGETLDYRTEKYKWDANFHEAGTMTWNASLYYDRSSLQTWHQGPNFFCGEVDYVNRDAYRGGGSKNGNKAGISTWILVTDGRYKINGAGLFLNDGNYIGGYPPGRIDSETYWDPSTKCGSDKHSGSQTDINFTGSEQSFSYQGNGQPSLSEIITGTINPTNPNEVKGSRQVQVTCVPRSVSKQSTQYPKYTLAHCDATVRWYFYRDPS
jgi:hypothetical protein